MGRASDKRRRAATIRKLQQAAGVDRDLATHMHDQQIEPQRLASRLRGEGLDAETRVAYTGDLDLGVEVTCVGCGRTARLAEAPPKDMVVMCPDCQRAGIK